VTAASGTDALAQLASSPRAPDLLLCDYRLRGAEDGVTVIEAIRGEFNADIPAVLVTGDTAPDRIRAIGASGLPVLHKPLREDELHEVLAYLLSARPRASGSGSEQPEPPGGDHRLGAIGHA
jgi:CheY-like chemotaxis protein